jgi:hypothetical protein
MFQEGMISGDNKVAMSSSEMPVGFRAMWFLFVLYPHVQSLKAIENGGASVRR